MNRLADASSPYLLQHKDNPVDWWQWSPEALMAAKAEDKPILLSVGYAACHWCHVMAHESFEDPVTAEIMNRLFINIKVDREERPDIDQIHMSALHALGEQGGWPLTMFLTADAKPFWGGTYFPNTPRFGRPSFTQVIQEVSRIVREEPHKVSTNITALRKSLDTSDQAEDKLVDITPDLLNQAAIQLFSIIDPVNGGTRGAPKFPNTSLFESLWRASDRTGDAQLKSSMVNTLLHISQGGIYDHIGGGFCRYAVDDIWLVPHFEKMLYDNGQLLRLLAWAFQHTGLNLFRERIEQTIDWLEREMLTPSGAYASSLDADSDGEEGKFYVWKPDELNSVLDKDDAEFYRTVYDITDNGNWEHISIPNRLNSIDRLPENDEERLRAIEKRLLAHRDTRIRPGLDDKVLADWNGYAITGLAEAALALHRPDWIAIAERVYGAIIQEMSIGDRLGHSWRDGKLIFPGLSTDHAAIIRAALNLHESTGQRQYLDDARRFEASVSKHHMDSQSGGYFLTADDAEDLFVRPRSILDEATPAANGLMIDNAIRLYLLTGDELYRASADKTIKASRGDIIQNIFSTCASQSAVDFALSATSIVITGPDAKARGRLKRAVYTVPLPNRVLMECETTENLPPEHPARGKTSECASAYICRGTTCSLPLDDPSSIMETLHENLSD